MKIKKICSLLLAMALTASLALPVGAAGSSFSDVPEGDTAVHADILRLMGVTDGVGDNRFNPSASLTRAEFCTMVVKFLQRGDEVALHSARTIFSDVTARHWALGYVNLAASLTVSDGDRKIPLISGVGNGKFEPDSKITLAQAATILIRVLGYSSEQTGALWPQSYMNLANSIGLTDGVNCEYGAVINRAQAARLFSNALACKTGGGAKYYTTLGTVKENAIILAVNVTTGDGSTDGAIRTSLEADPYLAAAGSVKPTALMGKRGALVLNEKSEIVTFVPDDSTATSITLSGDAQPSYVKGTDGKQYTVPSAAMVYTADAREGASYTATRDSLKSGMQITMYSTRGKIDAIYAGGSMATGTGGAVVVSDTPNVAMFHQLTGGADNFTVQKNRETIALSDLKPYDVVTYDSLNNVLIASDLRLPCIYEDAAPSAKAPTTITVLGHKFEVLDSAWDTIGESSIGKNVVLLLTADGKVAGMAQPGGQTRSTAIGMVTSGGAELFLPDGNSLKLTGTVTSSGDLSNQLVTLSSSSKGKISAYRLGESTPAGAFDVKKLTLAGDKVSPAVRLYEKVGAGAIAPISLSDLDVDSISASNIALFHKNTSGVVDYLVLKSITGNAYTYGVLIEGQQMTGTFNGEPVYNRTVTVENPEGGLSELVTGYSFKDGSFGGVAPGREGKAASVVSLTEIKNVSPSDFFVSQGVTYVSADGKNYRVWDDVLCYKNTAKTWFTGDTGAERLAACKAFSGELTVYLDPVGQRVRVVAAK